MSKKEVELNIDHVYFNDNRKDIDLVNFRGIFSMYMYTDDSLYRSLPENFKHHSIVKHIDDLKHQRIPNYQDESGPINIENVVKRIIKIYWKHGVKFSFVDVGSQYGNDSLDVGAFIKKHGHENKIYAFDCGMASNLCPYNFKLNLLDDIIHFERKAISNFSIPIQVFVDPEHTEDNHISRRKGGDLPSYIVDSVTLDDYNFQEENLILKIDTQGVEPLVFEGMQKLFEKKPTVIFEFTPWVVESLSVNPVEFLKSIPDSYVIFNLDTNTKMIHYLKKDNLESFVKKLAESKIFWTDLLIVDKSLIGYQDIVDDFKKSENFCT